ncbi:putative bifunctional diguanylate cyclase/phosphodiesterase [Acidovorax radicis]|uniref:putative bifunctional diguanylate cyclase/phosphodiesterase n=1 Tax=Acidovorax radicis TaxID=758826 RepID=UPI001CFB73E5|nr:bifunctional diguanylate cyclase/phosphodiesterase [Acidovorax radicis]UCU99929.1 bifunctional diguanylate cyclase/phosphodiesterase [Acidovorax radicis]
MRRPSPHSQDRIAAHRNPRLQSTRLQKWLAPYEADEPLAATFRAQQLQAVLRLTPLAMAVKIFNGAILVYQLAAHAPWLWLWLWLWMLALIFVAAQGTRAWMRARGSAPRRMASTKAIRRAARHAGMLGALWGTIPAVLLASVAPQRQMVILAISCGMTCAGGFALVTVPEAAISYVLLLGLGSAIGLAQAASQPGMLTLLCLLMAYALIVIASVRVVARSYGSRLTAEAQAAHQEQIVGLLLRDFEENTSDFLWEVSNTGALLHSSTRLDKALRYDRQTDPELGLVALLARTHAGTVLDGVDPAPYLQTLQTALQGTQPFRDLLVLVVIDGRLRWWALTAKPVVRLGHTLPDWRGVGVDITQKKHAEDERHRLAHFDVLTGLANRRHFQLRLQQQCAREDAGAGAAALLCLDMDNFKRVNDAYGHGNGDLLLKAVAQRMAQVIRGRDLVARLGGDEFAIVLDGASTREEVQVFCDRLLRTIEQPCDLAGVSITPQLSIGIAFLPRDGNHVDALLHHADLALYEAKVRGRGHAQFFSAEMDQRAQRRIALEDGLRSALAQGQLHLVYQPQWLLDSGRIAGVEALLRWTSERFGNVSPAEFIPVAEEAGLIRDIGLWVLETACMAAHQLPADLVVSVNLSVCQFDDAQLADKILQVTERCGLPPKRLELEITESVFLQDTDDVMATLHRLRQAGVRIALDDFGTGYSSLAYLRSFPFDRLKIDRSFIAPMESSPESEAIVQSVITLAQGLHMETTAEGIETVEQAQLLQTLGCVMGQGFYFARPLDLATVKAFIAAHPPATTP